MVRLASHKMGISAIFHIIIRHDVFIISSNLVVTQNSNLEAYRKISGGSFRCRMHPPDDCILLPVEYNTWMSTGSTYIAHITDAWILQFNQMTSLLPVYR